MTQAGTHVVCGVTRTSIGSAPMLGIERLEAAWSLSVAISAKQTVNGATFDESRHEEMENELEWQTKKYSI